MGSGGKLAATNLAHDMFALFALPLKADERPPPHHSISCAVVYAQAHVRRLQRTEDGNRLSFPKDGWRFIPEIWVTLFAFARRAKVPWQECNRMDERLKFVARVLDGEKFAALCRVRHLPQDWSQDHQPLQRQRSGRADRSIATALPARQSASFPNREADCADQAGQPNWGAPEIRERLARLYPDVHTPAISTVHAVLDRNGLVKPVP